MHAIFAYKNSTGHSLSRAAVSHSFTFRIRHLSRPAKPDIPALPDMLALPDILALPDRLTKPGILAKPDILSKPDIPALPHTCAHG